MQESPVSPRFGHVPMPLVLALLVLLPIGPVGWGWGRADAKPRPRPALTLAQIARRAGFYLSEFHGDKDPNRPVPGRFRERPRPADGSYVGKRPPAPEAT